MKRLFTILAVSAALGGCLTPSAYRQSTQLVGTPLSAAVARYGPPDQPVTGGAGAYSWSRGRGGGACKLTVRTDASEQITHASVAAVGFRTCKQVLDQNVNR